MLTCKKAADLLLDYLESNLGPDVQRAMQAHLDGCSTCVQFVETYKKTSELCRATLLQKVPAELGARLIDFLRQNTQPKR